MLQTWHHRDGFKDFFTIDPVFSAVFTIHLEPEVFYLEMEGFIVPAWTSDYVQVMHPEKAVEKNLQIDASWREQYQDRAIGNENGISILCAGDHRQSQVISCANNPNGKNDSR